MLPNWEASAMGSHIFFDHFGDQKRPSHISYAKNDVLKDAYDPFEGGNFCIFFVGVHGMMTLWPPFFPDVKFLEARGHRSQVGTG